MNDSGPYVAGLDLSRNGGPCALVVLAGTTTAATVELAQMRRGLDLERLMRWVGNVMESYPGVVLRVDATGLHDPVVEWMRGFMPWLPVQATQMTKVNRDRLVGLASRQLLKIPPGVAIEDPHVRTALALAVAELPDAEPSYAQETRRV